MAHSKRRDWRGEADAPPVNSLRPAAGAWVASHDRVLLIERSDNGNWCLPGGAMEFGESLPACAARETLEETGVQVEVTGLVGIFTDPGHRIEYLSDGEVRQEFAVIFRATPLRGEPTATGESTQAKWVPIAEVDDLPMDEAQRQRILWAAHHDEPWIDSSDQVPA